MCGSEVVHPEAGRHWEEVGQPPANLVVGVQGGDAKKKQLALVWRWSGVFALGGKLELCE